MVSHLSIQGDLKQSMLKKDELRAGTLRMLLAAVTNKEKEKRYRVSKAEPNLSEQELQTKSELSLQEIQEVAMSEAKKRRESIEAFAKGGRQELVDKETKELEVLKSYLPEQLSEDEIRQLVRDVVVKVGAASLQDIGKVMGALAPQTKGKADGALVSRIVRESLS